MVTGVTDGLFFTRPSPLPRGRHMLGRDHVAVAQRERLMIAVAELMASHGYRDVGVREIAAHARVSRAAFYEVFSDKDACVFAAYDRFIDVLVERLVGAVAGRLSWPATVLAVVDTYLRTLDADSVVARAFQVEMDALGRAARVRRKDALVGLATLLKERRDQEWPGAEHIALATYVGSVYAVRQLASDLLDDSQPSLTSLAPAIGPAIVAMLSPSPVPCAPPT